MVMPSKYDDEVDDVYKDKEDNEDENEYKVGDVDEIEN